MSVRHPFRVLAALAAAAAAAAAVAGCGASAYRFVGSVPNQVFFEVPAGWRQVSATTLAAEQRAVLGSGPAGAGGGSLVWSAAFDAARTPSAADIFSVAAEPVVYASVQVMNPALRGALSFDLMRDLLVPVTSQRRRQYAAAGIKLPALRDLGASIITAGGGVRGIGERYEVSVGGIPEVYTQVVLTNSDTTKLYLLVVQCDQACFLANQAQIDAVVRSFTVKGSS